MSARATLVRLMEDLPEERLCELLDFATFLNWQDEREGWRRFGQTQFARAYGPNEPEYSHADMKSESMS